MSACGRPRGGQVNETGLARARAWYCPEIRLLMGDATGDVIHGPVGESPFDMPHTASDGQDRLLLSRSLRPSGLTLEEFGADILFLP